MSETPRLPISPLKSNDWCGQEKEQSESSISTVTSDQLKLADFRRLRNRVNHSIKASKNNYYHTYLNNVGKAKATWNGINTSLSRKKNFAPASKLIIGDTVITDPHELINAFKRHCTDIGPNLAAKINPPLESAFLILLNLVIAPSSSNYLLLTDCANL